MKSSMKLFAGHTRINHQPEIEGDSGIKFFALSLYALYMTVYAFLLATPRLNFSSPRFLINTLFLFLLTLFLIYFNRFTLRFRIVFLTLVMMIPSLMELFMLGLLSFGKTIFVLAPILLAIVFDAAVVYLMVTVIGFIFLLAALGFSFGFLDAPEPDRIMRPVHLLLDTITLLTFSILFILIIDKLRIQLIQTFLDISKKNSELQEAENSLVIIRDQLNQRVSERMSELEEAKEMLLQAKERLSEQNLIMVRKRNDLDQTYQMIQQNQANLVQARKMASLGSLSLGIAHEINNPLNFIQGSLAILEKKIRVPENHQLSKILPIMKDAAFKISKIVKSLYQFGPGQEQIPGPSNLYSILDNCYTLLKPQTGAGTTIEIQKPDFTPVAIGLTEKLHQVFLNVLHNAIQAVSENGHIEVSFVVNLEKNTVVTRIADNGPGIPAELIEKITQPFFTTKPMGKGTGLGLYISNQIITEHHGTMKFESSPGNGTAVIIELPQA